MCARECHSAPQRVVRLCVCERERKREYMHLRVCIVCVCGMGGEERVVVGLYKCQFKGTDKEFTVHHHSLTQYHF